MAQSIQEQIVDIMVDTNIMLEGALNMPSDARGLVLFAHGSGSSRHSPRNQFVASHLNEAGLATLLFDLLTDEEGEVDQQARSLRFDIGLLAERVMGAVDWAVRQGQTRALNFGLFGSSTGAAAAIVAAANRPSLVSAVVSRGGRADMAENALSAVQAPTLLIVGGRDETVIDLNEQALAKINAKKSLEIVPGASHLFEEPGKLEQVADLARGWFAEHLTRANI
ncbi:MAG: dienelactone hydrolase family protein [Chloroflexota bacterium]